MTFDRIHEHSGNQIRYEKVVPDIRPVDTARILKDFESREGDYALPDDDEIDDVKIKFRKTPKLTQFVDFHRIDTIYFDKQY